MTATNRASNLESGRTSRHAGHVGLGSVGLSTQTFVATLPFAQLTSHIQLSQLDFPFSTSDEEATSQEHKNTGILRHLSPHHRTKPLHPTESVALAKELLACGRPLPLNCVHINVARSQLTWKK